MKTKIWIYSFVFVGIFMMIFQSCKKQDDDTDPPASNAFTDYDGNVYNTVTIGTQTWMKENLKVTHYRDGSSLPNITDADQWESLSTGAYCNYSNDENNVATYGRIYNWYAVNDSRKIAPAGWHVPTEAEWNTLINFLGGDSVAGGKLKETGTTHWLYINIGATNETGFTALPGGERSYDGAYSKLGEAGTWWTSSFSGAYAWQWIIGSYGADIGEQGSSMNYGFSVRCVKD